MKEPIINAPVLIYLDPMALRRLLSTHVVLICDEPSPSIVDGIAEVLLARTTDDHIVIETADSKPDERRILWNSLAIRIAARIVVWISDGTVANHLIEVFGTETLRIPRRPAEEEGCSNVVLLQALAAAHQRSHLAMAQTALAVHREAYVLRRDLENAKIAQFELQEISRKSGVLVPWLNHTVSLGRDSISLMPGQTITQILPCSSKGFAGFDLHFDCNSSVADLEIRASLHIADSGEIVETWSRNLYRIGGWIHFRLSRALDELGAAMLIRLEINGRPTETHAPRLTLSDIERTPEIHVNINNNKINGKALAFRVWQGPPGLIMPIENNPAHALKINNTIGITLELDWHLRNAKGIGPIVEYNSNHPGSVGMIDGAFQLHVLPNNISLARITDGMEDGYLEIMSEVKVENDSGPYAEFLIGLSQSNISNEDLVFKLEENLIAHSGWHTAGPTGTNLVTVERPSTLRDKCDIILATRVKNNISADFGWARFRKLRATWNPRCAYPLNFDITLGAEPLHRLRLDTMERRRVRQTGLTTPIISLACAIHRPNDITNLLRQLAKISTPNVEILIAANGPRITSQDIERLKSALPEAIVWHDSGQNLPSVLNTCIDRATGDFITKIDADDFYGENYLSDLLSEFIESGADLVGKSEFGVALPDEGRLVIHRGAPHHQFVKQLAGGTLFCSLATARNTGFDESLIAGSDYAFQQKILSNGGSIWSGDIFNYIHVRRTDEAHHTWKGTYNDYRHWPIYRDYNIKNMWMLFV